MRQISDKGSALPAVLMFTLIVLTLATAAVSLATAQTKEEIYYENDFNALNAAEAGINKYLWYLNKEYSTIALNTAINYPDDSPVAAFKIDSVIGGESQKKIQVTGWMLNDPSVTVTVSANFKKKSLTEYVYLTTKEPDNIWYGASDNIYGPYHTNSIIHAQNHPNFWGPATSVGGIVYPSGGTAANHAPIFHNGYAQVTPVPFPTDNAELLLYGNDSDGYYYEGRTCIRLNADGTITVLNQYHTPTLETLALPANGVIYVNEKSGSDTNKFTMKNGNVFISGILDGRLTVAAKQDIFITTYDPTVMNLASAPVTGGIFYKDTAFSTVLDTATGSYPAIENGGPAEADMLGLVADSDISVLTRGWFTGSATTISSTSNVNINAAMMSIHGSFINSDFLNGASPDPVSPESPGILTVRGAIIQETRGAVGKSYGGAITSGFSKNYAHDPRMLFDSPPHFLKPDGFGWEMIDWNELR